MRRRDLLAVTTGGLCGLAGCTGSPFERLQTERPSTDGDEEVDSSDDADRNVSESESDDTITVGDPDAVPFLDAHPPHELELRNEGETERTFSVTISTSGDEEGVEKRAEEDVTDDENATDDGDDGAGNGGDAEDGNGGEDALLEREFDLPAGETLTFVLVEPRSYSVTVTTNGDGGRSTVTDGIDRHPFDCTRSRTSITFRGSGVQTESTSTSISCPDPEIADSTLEVGEQGCANRTDGDGATVEFADEAVVVDGDITTPTPCHVPSLVTADYDDRRDVLSLTVADGEQADENCIDCLGTASYEARIDLEGRYPGRVVVSHEHRGEDERITTTEYSTDG